jgi:hypothetical protein
LGLFWWFLVLLGVNAGNNTFKIKGGALSGLGGTTTSPTASVSSQNSVIFSGVNANTLLHIQSSYGEALTYMVPKTVSTILYSSAKLSSSQIYNIYTGGSVTQGTAYNGLYTSGTFNADNTQQVSSFTTSYRVTQIGGQTGPGGGGPMGF